MAQVTSVRGDPRRGKFRDEHVQCSEASQHNNLDVLTDAVALIASDQLSADKH
jgi:hypothetical protein